MQKASFLVWWIPLTIDVRIISSIKPLSANLPLCSGRSRVPDHRSLPDPEIVSDAAANRCQQGKKIHLSCWGSSSVQNADHQDLQEVSCLCFKLGCSWVLASTAWMWGKDILPLTAALFSLSYTISVCRCFNTLVVVSWIWDFKSIDPTCAENIISPLVYLGSSTPRMSLNICECHVQWVPGIGNL